MKRSRRNWKRAGAAIWIVLVLLCAGKLFFYATDLWRADAGEWLIVLVGALATLLAAVRAVRDWCDWEAQLS